MPCLGVLKQADVRADRRRHLMQVVHSLNVGGSERLACELAKHVDPARLRTSVCAVDTGGPLIQEPVRSAIPAFVLHRRPGFNWRLRGPRRDRMVPCQRRQALLDEHSAGVADWSAQIWNLLILGCWMEGPPS